MANDRIWIQCRECEEKILIFEYWPYRSHFGSEAEDIEKFMAMHLLEVGTFTLNGDPHFVLITESDPPQPSA